VPFAPGALCAFGLTASALEYEGSVTVKTAAGAADAAALEKRFQELDAAGFRQMTADGAQSGEVIATRAADMRYVGQSYELEVPLPSPLTPDDIVHAQDELGRIHQRVYGHVSDRGEVEFVNLRMTHSYRIDPDERRPILAPVTLPRLATAATRRCWFREA